MVTKKTLQAARSIAVTLMEQSAQAFLVGGCVRDALMGMQVKDIDIEVHGISFENLVKELQSFAGTEHKVSVHGEFVVAQLRLSDGTDIEFSVPRKERANTQGGHKGFDIMEDPFCGVGAAIIRRDLTVNALMIHAWNAPHLLTSDVAQLEEWVIDECQVFLQDISLNKVVLRPVSDAFKEDPLRVLRAMRFVAKVPNAVPSSQLIEVCKEMKDTFHTLPIERIFMEFDNMLMSGKWFVRAFDFLCATGWIEHFPRLQQMAMTAQDPVWHPEGNVLRHTAHTLEAAAQRRSIWQPCDTAFQQLMWGLMIHDAWKPETFIIGDDNKIHNPNHDEQAGQHGAQWLRDTFDVPVKVAKAAAMLARVHMCHAGMTQSTNFNRAARRLARKVDGVVTPMQIQEIIFADMQGRPPLTLDNATNTVEKVVLLTSALMDVANTNDGILGVTCFVTGDMIMAHGIPAGPRVGEIKSACLEAQVNGEFEEKDAESFLKQMLSSI